jgi:Ulp1 family protease
MNTFFFTMLEDMQSRSEYSFAKCERVLKRKKVNLRDYQYLIVPVNVRASHWFMMAYEVETAKVWIVDSMIGGQEGYQKYLSALSPFLYDYFNPATAIIDLSLY